MIFLRVDVDDGHMDQKIIVIAHHIMDFN